MGPIKKSDIFTCLRNPSTENEVNDKEKKGKKRERETRKKPLTKLVVNSEMMGRSHGNGEEEVEKRRGSGDMVCSFLFSDDDDDDDVGEKTCRNYSAEEEEVR